MDGVGGGLIDAAGFVLAGGLSSRMGREKALLELAGEPLVARGVRTLAEICVEVAISGPAELGRFGRVVMDEQTGCGPLGGIVACLQQSDLEWNVFLSVDTPFVPVAALERLLCVAEGSLSIGVLARVGGQVQPLCGVYARGALNGLRRELAAGRWKVMDALAAVGSYQVIDFLDEDWFKNLNTPGEFAAALDMAKRVKPATSSPLVR